MTAAASFKAVIDEATMINFQGAYRRRFTLNADT